MLNSKGLVGRLARHRIQRHDLCTITEGNDKASKELMLRSILRRLRLPKSILHIHSPVQRSPSISSSSPLSSAIKEPHHRQPSDSKSRLGQLATTSLEYRGPLEESRVRLRARRSVAIESIEPKVHNTRCLECGVGLEGRVPSHGKTLLRMPSSG